MVDVGALDEFEPGTLALREVGGQEVVVVRWGDQVYVVGNRCPHQGGPLCRGHLRPSVGSSRQGAIELDESRPTLACSWHGWEFDVESGSMLWDEGYRVRTYPVEVTGDGRVLVEPKRRRTNAAPAEIAAAEAG